VPLRQMPFRHGAVYRSAQAPILAPSYHCSRYNLNTGRLTPAMFTALFRQVRALVDGP
jgi:uracil-DNA glycosylase